MTAARRDVRIENDLITTVKAHVEAPVGPRGSSKKPTPSSRERGDGRHFFASAAVLAASAAAAAAAASKSAFTFARSRQYGPRGSPVSVV